MQKAVELIEKNQIRSNSFVYRFNSLLQNGINVKKLINGKLEKC